MAGVGLPGIAATSVWTTPRAGSQPAGSFGEFVDNQLSLLAQKADWTAVRAALVDRLSIIAAGGANELTAARMVLLDKLAILASGGAGELTVARIAQLDKLALLAAGGAGELTPARTAFLDRLQLIAAGGAGELTPARTAFLDRLQLIAAGGAGELTAARATNLDRLDVTVSTVAPAALYDSLYPATSVVSSASPDTFGAWVQVSANIGNNKRLYGVVVSMVPTTGVTSFEFEVGEGAAAAEIAVARVNLSQPTSSAAGAASPLHVAMALALTNAARISARVRDNDAVANTWRIGILVK